MQTINIMTKRDIEELVAIAVAKKIDAIANEIIEKIEDREPKMGPHSCLDDDPIAILSLTNRVHNALQNRDIYTVGQLCGTTKNDLWSRPGIARITLVEIQTRLARYGRKLKTQ